MLWLIDCGLIHKIQRVTAPNLPLKAYEDLKAETNLKAKSLKSYYEKFNPLISVRTAMADYKREDWLLNMPLWAIEVLENNIR